MNRVSFDVDIDFGDRSQALNIFKPRLASIIKDGKSEKHNTGVYFQPIPCDPFTGLANIDYRAAEELGYFKIDFLNLHIYEELSNDDVDRLVSIEPPWDLLCEPEFVKHLIHIKDYSALISKYRPKSIDDLSIILALIRPSKKHLQNESWENIKKSIWDKPEEGYWFKRSHSISYATAIVVQMNYIAEQLLRED